MTHRFQPASGRTISENHHLPFAVEFKNRSALNALDDACLGKLTTECEQWLACMRRFQKALRTEVAMTEWKVHMRQELAEVASAHARLREEVRARRGRTADGLGTTG